MDAILLWTIKSEAEWAELQRGGTLRADPEAVAREWWEFGWQRPYDWMAAQLEARVGPPPPGCVYPVWAWYQWESALKRRPDLRDGQFRRTSGVRLELELPRALVLLSDFQLWHYALNYWYLPASEADGSIFDTLLAEAGLDPALPLSQQVLPPELNALVEATWERMFGLDWAVPDRSSPRHQKAIQAVFWELRLEHVRRVTPFRARSAAGTT